MEQQELPHENPTATSNISKTSWVCARRGDPAKSCQELAQAWKAALCCKWATVVRPHLLHCCFRAGRKEASNCMHSSMWNRGACGQAYCLNPIYSSGLGLYGVNLKNRTAASDRSIGPYGTYGSGNDLLRVNCTGSFLTFLLTPVPQRPRFETISIIPG